MTGLVVRLLAQAIIDYWHTRRPPQGRHFLPMLAAAFAPALAHLLFSHVRRTKSFATSIMLIGAVVALGGLAVALARGGPYMGKPARRRRNRTTPVFRS